MPAVSGMTAAFRKAFKENLAVKGLPPNDHLKLLLACLWEHKLIYHVEIIDCKLFLTHKNNRGGLLLSPHNAHRNAAKIHVAGANISNLANALCVELASHGPMRDEHIQKNMALIERALGLLAPVNGDERYLTLSCGHTAAFCKVAQMLGETSAKELQIADSTKIDVQKLCKSNDFKTMIHTGWGWDVVRACVDEEFPDFSQIAQKALNTQNNANTAISEFEVMMTIDASLSDCGFKALPNFKELALDNINAMCAPSSSYSGALFDFVTVFGGGAGAPHVALMDTVAKGFGCNVALQGTYWAALGSAQFSDKTCMFPLVRVSLALANLTSDKVEDGVAKLLQKSDISRVASKAKAAEATEAEEFLKDCMAISEAVGGTAAIAKPVGQAFVRMGLKLTGKEKQGRERSTYTIDQLRTMFLADVGQILGEKVTFEAWDGKADASLPPQGEPTSSSVSATSAVTSLSDHDDPVFIAGQAGFKIGKIVVEKSIDASPDRLYTIFTIASKVVLQQAVSYTMNPAKVTVSLSELMTNWSVSKTEPPVVMMDPPALPSIISKELCKLELLQAILAVSTKQKKHELTFYRRPDEVRTTAAIKENALVLVPVCSMAQIASKNTSANTGVSLGVRNEVEMFALPPSKPPMLIAPAWGSDAIASPFWWVQPVPTQKAATMEYTTIEHKGIEVPVLTNPHTLEAFTKLTYYVKPKAKVQPLQNVIVPEEEPPVASAHQPKRAAAKGAAPKTAPKKAKR